MVYAYVRAILSLQADAIRSMEGGKVQKRALSSLNLVINLIPYAVHGIGYRYTLSGLD